VNKGYTKITNELLDTCDLSLQARYLLCVLLRHRGSDGECFPRQSVLGKELGRTSRRVRVILNELLEYGAITKKRRGFNMSNDYFINAKFIVKDIPQQQKQVYKDGKFIPSDIGSKKPKSTEANNLINSTQLIEKDNIYVEKRDQIRKKFRQIMDSEHPSQEARKIYGISTSEETNQVYNPKTKKLESVREILESKKINSSDNSNLTTGVMSESQSHNDSNVGNHISTKSKSNQVVGTDSTNVDSDHIGDETC